MFPLRVIGFQREFSYESSYAEIPKFWDEICEKYAANVYAGNAPANAYEQALVDNCIGEYGVCIDDLCGDRFRYLIAGKYTGGEVPEGMVLYEFPRGDWAVFDCVGPMPETLQSLNTRIFREWLPGNPDYPQAQSIFMSRISGLLLRRMLLMYSKNYNDTRSTLSKLPRDSTSNLWTMQNT